MIFRNAPKAGGTLKVAASLMLIFATDFQLQLYYTTYLTVALILRSWSAVELVEEKYPRCSVQHAVLQLDI
jgi:hypothetical protein